MSIRIPSGTLPCCVEVALGRLMPLVVNDLLNLVQRRELWIDGLQAPVYPLVREHVRVHPDAP